MEKTKHTLAHFVQTAQQNVRKTVIVLLEPVVQIIIRRVVPVKFVSKETTLEIFVPQTQTVVVRSTAVQKKVTRSAVHASVLLRARGHLGLPVKEVIKSVTTESKKGRKNVMMEINQTMTAVQKHVRKIFAEMATNILVSKRATAGFRTNFQQTQILAERSMEVRATTAIHCVSTRRFPERTAVTAS